MDVSIRPSTIDDAAYLAPRLREADRIEIDAFSDATPDSALLRGLSGDTCLTGTVDDRPVCMFGFGRTSLISPIGIPWLLGTDEVRSIPKTFLIKSREIVNRARQRYALLENWVDSENAISIRWLRWLGFSIETANPIERKGRSFYRFTIGGA